MISASLDKLAGAAHLLGTEFLSRLGSDGYIDSDRKAHAYSRIIQWNKDRPLEKITKDTGAVMTPSGEMLFTLTILVPDIDPPQRIYVDLATRLVDGKPQYCMWSTPDSLHTRAEVWMDDVHHFADAIETCIKHFFLHDQSKGDLADTSVSIGPTTSSLYDLV